MNGFGMETGDTIYLGEEISKEGNNFEGYISELRQKIDACGSSWTNGGYPAFKAQTEAAAKELTDLRDFFARYGKSTVDFANQTQDAINRTTSYINSNY